MVEEYHHWWSQDFITNNRGGPFTPVDMGDGVEALTLLYKPKSLGGGGGEGGAKPPPATPTFATEYHFMVL